MTRSASTRRRILMATSISPAPRDRTPAFWWRVQFVGVLVVLFLIGWAFA